MVWQFLTLIWLHFIADFLLQSDKVATSKSSCTVTLGYHALLYGAPFLFFGWQFALFNAAAHFAVDFITSTFTTYFHINGKRHMFFVTIGLDQAVHMTVLILSMQWLLI